MLKRTLLVVMLMLTLALTAAISIAQEEDQTTTSTSPQSTINYFVVICEDRAVVNMTGTLLTVHDVYFQVFSGAGGTGEPLSDLRRVEADGDYTFSEVIQYPEGTTIEFNGIGSAYITISREGSPDNSAFAEYVDDLQDGCSGPLYELGVSSVTGETVVGEDGTPVSGITYGPGTTSQGTSSIVTPFGGVLNPGYVPPRKDAETGLDIDEFEMPRQETAGLIFAECDDYPVAEPGIIYDNDQVTIYWSWFAQTAEQVQDHIDNANYSVTYYQTLPLPNVVRSNIQQIGSDYWVFYYSRLGNLRPGRYWIEYKVTWDQRIGDGYAEYGPFSDNDLLRSGCSFDVLPNPDGIAVSHNAWPYQ